MPRSFVIGNGNLLVGFDANYDVRDLFYPYVGMENQTVGNVCRTGFWIDGKFAWVGDPAWKRQIGYWGDTLVGDVTLTHPDLGLTVHFEDYVDMVRDYFIRNLRLTVSQPAEQVRVFFHHDWWIRGQDLVVNKGQHSYLVRTRTYWDRWSDKEHRHIEEALGHGVRHLFRRSVLTVRTQVDNRGGIVAANDYDITKFARDTYSYVWPRDGALVANALDRAGHEDVTRTFFEFCHRAITQAGFMAHKYAPDGLPGSSWHPWVDGMGKRVLPIQEDETGLVLWSLWQHYAIHRNLDFTMQLYSALVIPAAECLAQYIDPRNGMVRPSWDLWEERWGVHAFTVGSVWAGLRGAAHFAELYGDEKSFERFTSAAEQLRHATDDWLWRPELDRFARRLTVAPDGSLVTDNVLDSAIYGLWRFGMYDASDPRIVKTMTAIKEQLSNKAETGGQARYSNDYYFQVERDVSVTPRNPWFICTLWLAQWYIAVATAVEQLQPAQDMIDWVVTHKSAAGMLSEQVDPHTGAPLSVAPLTWSHAEFMVTVDA